MGGAATGGAPTGGVATGGAATGAKRRLVLVERGLRLQCGHVRSRLYANSLSSPELGPSRALYHLERQLTWQGCSQHEVFPHHSFRSSFLPFKGLS